MLGSSLLYAVVCGASAAASLASCAGHSRGGAGLIPSAPGHGALTAGAHYSSTILADGPTAYYRLDDTGTIASDSSGNGLNGTIGASVTKGAPGLPTSDSDTAMSFPGTAAPGGVVGVPQNTLLQPASAVSIEMWLRFAATPAAWTVALAYGTDSTYAPYDFYFVYGKIVAQFYLSSGVVTAASPAALNPNTTYHVAATYDGTTARLYVNGTLVASTAKAGTLTGYTAGYGLSIGDDAGYSDPAFSGTLDEVAVYAGKALSAAQVQNHYNAGIGSASPSPSPAPTPAPGGDPYATAVLQDSPSAYYRLDGTATSAADSSGHGLTGSVGASVLEGSGGLLTSSSDTAMSFPGLASSGGVVRIPQNAALEPTTAVSMEMWLRFAATPAPWTVALAYGTDSNYAPYDFYFVYGRLVAQFYLSSGVVTVSSPSALSANTTYYAAATYDGTTARLYVNGAQAGSTAKAGTLTGYTAGYGLSIGDDAGYSDPAYNGTIDEVAIYAGTALTATQIANHYNAGTGSAAPAAVDWSTFGYDLQRTGYNPDEKTIGTGSFGTMHAMWSTLPNLGYFMVGEPAVAMNVNVNGVNRNLIYDGSYSGMFYAVDADTGAIVWSKQLGTTTYTCASGFTDNFGVEGAATLDRARNRIYVPDGQDHVHALDLATGTENSGWPVTIATTPSHDFIYAGLTYNPNNGILYAETSSTCDISPWYGRISAINASTAAVTNTFYPTQGAGGGGIWGFGGASVDPSTNNVFIAVGNASGQPQNAYYAEQIVELSADLSTVIAHNYPSIPVISDADFGATPLLFQPPGCPPLLAAVNKSGAFVLYNRTDISAGPTQTILMSAANDTGSFIGVPAYDPVTNDVYVGLPSTYGIYKPGAGAFGMQSNCTLNPTPVWNAVFGPDGASTTVDVPRSPISIANGVLYVSGYTDNTTYAFNAATGAKLWSAPLSDNGIVGPVVVNGRLYVGDVGGTIHAWKP